MIDPLRAHGAWVYLFVSIGAGALVRARRGVEPAMLLGTGFAGGFLVAAAIASGLRSKARQAAVGAGLLLTGPPLALWLGAEPESVALAGCGVLPAGCAIVFARRYGSVSRAALVSGLAAIALGAPAAALAGGAEPARAALLFGLLWPFLLLAQPAAGRGRRPRRPLGATGLARPGPARGGHRGRLDPGRRRRALSGVH